MKKNICFVIIFFSVIQKKEKKKEDSKVLALNKATYENAIDVPVDKVGVIINIDSLGFFNHNSQNLEENINSEVIQNQIKLLNTKFDVAQLIKDKSVKILDENNYKYDMIHQFNQNEIPKDLVTKENVKKKKNKQLQ